MKKENVQNNGRAEEQTLLGHQHMKAGEVKEAAECYQRAATLGYPAEVDVVRVSALIEEQKRQEEEMK